MVEAGFQIRLATPNDVDKIKGSSKYTLANPEGRPQRKRYEDAVQRNELLVLSHYDPKERTDQIEGFLEWHSRVDDAVTIRDAGTTGEEPNPGILKRLIRELLRMFHPPSASVKVREDQRVWNEVFRDLPGFELRGREYTRPHYRYIWEWTPDAERAALRPRRGEMVTRPGGRG
ncbi:MAG: hypothetical protein HYY04_16590 [Chloroflexi bacterium]|nr:hypothetical protein [Chloroflexota bacterium]